MNANALAPAITRHYQINMPQMALGGLSEAWLFREIGDIHWSMISAGLGAVSSALADANGDRLYATFTRLRIESTAPLLAFEENDEVNATGKIVRFGGGVFFGDVNFGNAARNIEATLMSSFTKRERDDSNLSLLKGQPVIPADSPVAVVSELPAFAQEYRTVRAEPVGETLFETEYEIMPFHDINGVGLLYFAAYPTINDLCEARHFGGPAAWCMESSTISRDVHYYGNCDLNDRIIYRLHHVGDAGGRIALTSSLTRASDGVMIARLITTKAVGLRDVARTAA